MVRLIHRQGRLGVHTFRGDEFYDADVALDEARKRNAAGINGDFLIEDTSGRIIMNDAEIAVVL
jgi:hypothetical protein